MSYFIETFLTISLEYVTDGRLSNVIMAVYFHFLYITHENQPNYASASVEHENFQESENI